MEKYTDKIITIGKKAFHKYLRVVKDVDMNEEEFVSSAMIGASKAFKKFNPNKSANLMSYAFPYIKQEIRLLLTDKMQFNKHNYTLSNEIYGTEYPKHSWPRFLCMADLLNLFSDVLDNEEKNIICLKYCDNLSDYKISKKFGIDHSTVTRIARSAHNKIRGEILRHGEVEDINDIRSNILSVYADRKKNELLEKIANDNLEL